MSIRMCFRNGPEAAVGISRQDGQGRERLTVYQDWPLTCEIG